jgi:hypothetical protein
MMFTLLMNKKNCVLIAIVVVLAGVYVVYFTNWFQPRAIHISSTTRRIIQTDQNARAAAAPIRLYFDLGGADYSLTEVKVVPLAGLQTNKFAQPVWHLVSDEGSDDVNAFFYGENIRGMDPAVAGARPEPLQPGVTYRLFVAAGRARGQHTFTNGPAPITVNANR